MESFWRDCKYTLRTLARSPGFTLVAVLTLAVGIGVNSAIFSVVNGVLLQPLPYKDPGQLVRIIESNPPMGFPFFAVSPPNFLDWREQSRSFDAMTAINTGSVNYAEGESPERWQIALVTPAMFPTLGIDPLLGRGFRPEEEKPGADGVVVLSHRLWEQRFGSDPNILGRKLTLSGNPVEVVGVMPPGFAFPNRDIDLWRPFTFDERAKGARGAHYLAVVARLKPGVSQPQAETEMKALAQRLAEQFPDTNRDWTVVVRDMHELMVTNVRPALLILWGAVGFVILIACANMANLMLARATVREREVAVRAALGASPGRILQQLLTESVLLALAGGVVGLLLAYWALPPLIALSAGSVPRIDSIRIDRWVLVFTLALATATGIFFGLAPALRLWRTDLHQTLKEGSRRSTGTGSHRLRGLLVAVEMALAVVLVIGASLLIRSLWRLQDVNPGFQAKNVLTFRVNLYRSGYPEPANVNAFYESLLARIRALPGVESVGATHRLPMAGGYFLTFTIGGKPAPEQGKEPSAAYRTATPDFFRTMGIPLMRGRVFNERDVLAAPMVAAVSEAFARRYFPNEEPLGQRLDIGNGSDGYYEVVGVVGNVKHAGLDTDDDTIMYVPATQDPFRDMAVVIRTLGDPMSLAGAVRKEVTALDRSLPVFAIQTMEEIVTGSVAQPKFATLLLGIFAGIALLLAMVGIYGVISYSVSQRTHEIGIRMALGARAPDVLRLVVGQGMRLTLSGIALGLAASFALTRWMETLLFQVKPTDPVTFAGVAVLLGAVALAACWIPARRATRVDPVIALRYE